jgi:hypothetical protein
MLCTRRTFPGTVEDGLSIQGGEKSICVSVRVVLCVFYPTRKSITSLSYSADIVEEQACSGYGLHLGTTRPRRPQRSIINLWKPVDLLVDGQDCMLPPKSDCITPRHPIRKVQLINAAQLCPACLSKRLSIRSFAIFRRGWESLSGVDSIFVESRIPLCILRRLSSSH